MKRFFFVFLCAQPLAAADFTDPSALVARAVALDPSLAALRADADAAAERIAGAGALPNPMLMAGVQNKLIDLRDDEMMTMYMVGASQRLTRRVRRDALTETATLAARVSSLEYDSARAGVERDVMMAWYALAAADAQLRTSETLRELIDAVVAASRVRYEVGTSLQADVVRAQLQQSDLEREIIRLRGARRAALAQLLPLLALPLDTDVPWITLPEKTFRLEISGGALPPDDHPLLLALESTARAAEEQIRIVESERRPDIDLEAQYGYRRLQADMVSLTARMELPIRRDRTIEPRVREAILRRDAARIRVEEARRALTQSMAAAIAAHDEANEQIRLYEEVLVPQAEMAFESTLTAYQTGRASFDATLATQSSYLRLRLQYYDLLARHAQAVTQYEALRRGARAGSIAASAPLLSSAAGAAAPSSMGSMN